MREILPPLASLYAFVLVAQSGGLAAAAERLNFTQPAISRRIRELEAHLGVALVQRGPNAVRLTEAGRDYALALGASFDAIRKATAALKASPTRPLRVRANHTWALRWLIPRLPRFKSRHPGQDVEVTTTILPEEFKRDPGDVAVRIADSPPTPTATRLNRITIAPFAAPELAKRVRREGLRGVTLLGSRVVPDHWTRWGAATNTELPATAPVLFEWTLLAVQAAVEGLGVVIASPNLVTEDVRRRRLVALRRDAVITDSYYWLVLPSGAPRPAALAFRDWLLEELAAEMIAPGADPRR